MTKRIGKVNAKKNEDMFRSKNSKTNFMVVIDKCGTGWDFKDLNNVVDLTFTRNPKVIIQRFARTIRLPDNGTKPISKYIYCYDQTRSTMRVRADLGSALAYMTERGILCGGKDLEIPKFILDQGMLKDGEEIIDDISIAVDLQTMDEFVKCTKDRTMCFTLEEIAEKEENSYWFFWRKLILGWKEKSKNNPKVENEAKIFFKELAKVSIENNSEKNIELLTFFKEKCFDVYRKYYGNRAVIDVLKSEGVC
jgi:hypothetical protein